MTTEQIYETAASIMIGIHVVAQLGKQSLIDSTCSDKIGGLYGYCKFVIAADSVLEAKALV